MPDTFQPAADPNPGHIDLACAGGNSFNRQLGLEVTDLTPESAQQLGYDATVGALITGVTKDGLACRAGLRQGMIVLRAGAYRVKNAADFVAVAEKSPLKNGLILSVRTSAGRRIVVLHQWTFPVPILAQLETSVAPFA
jgi:hypothetical protein